MQHSRTQRKCSGNKRQTSSWAMLNRCFYQKRQRELPPIQACTRQWRFAGNGQSSLDCTRQRRHYKIKAAFFAKLHLCIESVIVKFLKCDIHWSAFVHLHCITVTYHCFMAQFCSVDLLCLSLYCQQMEDFFWKPQWCTNSMVLKTGSVHRMKILQSPLAG